MDSWMATSSHEDGCWSDGEMQELSLFCDQVAWVVLEGFEPALMLVRKIGRRNPRYIHFD
jgi:hypothetical protein